MTTKEKILAAQLLNQAADHFGDHPCNDWEWPKDWTVEERTQFRREYHNWNDGGREFNPQYPHLPDYAVMKYLASKLHCEADPT